MSILTARNYWVVTALLLIFSMRSLAQQWSSSAGDVTSIYSHNGIVIIDTAITDGPCGDGHGFWWPISDEDSSIMLSLSLTSQTTNKRIKVIYNATTPECSHNRAKITHLLLMKS